jgi:hypothetical protein
MNTLSAKLTKKSNDMNEYFIKSYHGMYDDDYNDGEGEMINFYMNEAKVHAYDPIDAIKEYFNTQFYYSFDESLVYTDAEDSKNVVWYDVMVNELLDEADPCEVELWKNGKLKLYNNNIKIELYQVVPVKI